jgi:drug/metabolite transporter (DMT)-like permease
MNYTGLAMIIASLVMFYHARDLPAGEQTHIREQSTSKAGDLDTQSGVDAGTQAPNVSKEQTAKTIETSDMESDTTGGSHEVMSSKDAKTCEDPGQLRSLAGFLMCMLSGVFTGNTFTPAAVLAESAHHSSDQMDYAWSSFAGMVVTSFVALVLYIMIRGEKVHTPKAVVLPALGSGAIGAIALSAFFKANQELSMVISVPIIDSLPCLIALAIGVFFFKEIKTKRGRAFAAGGVLIQLVAILFIALSD